MKVKKIDLSKVETSSGCGGSEDCGRFDCNTHKPNNVNTRSLKCNCQLLDDKTKATWKLSAHAMNCPMASQDTIEIIIDESAAEQLDLKAGTYLVKDTPSQEKCTCKSLMQAFEGNPYCPIHKRPQPQETRTLPETLETVKKIEKIQTGQSFRRHQQNDWEIEFDKRWSGDECPAYQAFEPDIDNPIHAKENIKQFIRSHDKEVREAERKRIAEILKKLRVSEKSMLLLRTDQRILAIEHNRRLDNILNDLQNNKPEE